MMNAEGSSLKLGISESTFRSMVNEMRVGVLLQGPRAEMLLSNPAALDLLGLSEDQLMSRTSFDPEWNVIHEDGSPFPGPMHPVPKSIATREPVRNVVMGVYRPGRGDRVWLLVDAIPDLGEEGEVRHVVCTFIDISERKKAEAEVVALLAEKEIILKEVHHRIKNNMSTICGLLSLQARNAGEGPVAVALDDAASRVNSMMLLYEKLYQSAAFQALSLRDYLPCLIDEIIGNFPSRSRLEVVKEVEDLVVDAKRLSSLGIIVNELLTNTMKYAFAEAQGGRITVSAASRDGRLILTVRDDGRGVPEAVDFEGSQGFGLALVLMLARQLGGTAKLERGKGTSVVLEIPL
jgi:PAS domain S-box-containing protein